MIIIFYDKNFKPLQNNASLNVGKYSLTKRAVEIDECTITSEAFTENINPCFLVMKNDYGRYYYGGFAGVPELTKDNQTKCKMSDLKTLLNNEIVTKKLKFGKLESYFSFLFGKLKEQVIGDSFVVELNTDDITELDFDKVFYPIENGYEVINVFEEMQKYLKYYDLCITSFLNIPARKIIYYIKKINKEKMSLRLWEVGILNYGKWVASVNEAQAVVASETNLSFDTQKYILLENNTITTDLSLRNIYPIKKKFFLEQDFATGRNKAIEALANARYNESIELNVNNTPFEKANFETLFNVYTERANFYKSLPVGSITEKEDGSKKIKLGYKNDSIVLLFKK